MAAVRRCPGLCDEWILMTETVKKILIAILIGGLCVSAFFIRYNNFKRPGPRTTDEVVYYVMARQMEDNIFAYNASGYALKDAVTHHGTELPDYFFDPLFKHPPAFVLMIYTSVKMFGAGTHLSAGFFPIFCGALALIFVYLLGRRIGGRAAGILAAGFMFIDPVGIMSSQKVWMDAPLMFFMLLTVYLYYEGIGRRRPLFFWLGGAAAGLAVMVKYPGILTLAGLMVFVLLCRPRLVRDKMFLASLALPAVISLPWFLLNYYVYGPDFFLKSLHAHEFGVRSLYSWVILGVLISMGLLAAAAWRHPREVSRRFEQLCSSRFVFYGKLAAFMATLVFIQFYFSRSLNFYEVPAVEWAQGSFSGQPRWFYFQRLLRFCFLYAFAYLAFFDPFFKPDPGRFLLKINAFLIIVFFAAWGNFQCRYILPALPFLMILSADYIWRLLGVLARINWVALRLLLQAAVLILVVLAVCKTMLINYEVSFTNNMCYF